jgi:hypothetical protein
MCKERIENTAKKAGAKKAIYSIDLQTLTIETDNNASSDEILKKSPKQVMTMKNSKPLLKRMKLFRMLSLHQRLTATNH